MALISPFIFPFFGQLDGNGSLAVTVACVKYPESLFNSDTFVGIYATISANTSDETPPEPPVP